ncbi:MAG: choice-of-anchor D domain-containing protein [Desulfobacterales bacterium]|nr:choice-of-anchor D domain-containing protein [Desulfobacterales bacterium]
MKNRIISATVLILIILFCKGNLLAKTFIDGGALHTLVIRDDGTVWTWGFNYYGQLGDGTNENKEISLQVPGLENIIALDGNGYFSIALRNDGTVWSWGRNYTGQLGDGTLNDKNSPVTVPGLNNVIAIAAGANHAAVLINDGTVRAWGSNRYGQLGNGTTANKTAPVQASGLNNVTAIAAGGNYTVALKNDGTVWTWGFNQYGQLGDGTNEHKSAPGQVPGLSNVSAIISGANYVIAVKDDGTAWGWGRNKEGQIGDGTTEDKNMPVQVSGLSNITAIAAGGNHTIALDNNNKVWTWGDNEFGQIGDGTTEDKTVPIQVSGLDDVYAVGIGGKHTMAIKNDETVWLWGDNSQGQIGDGTKIRRNRPVQPKGLWGQDYILISASPVIHNFGKVKVKNNSEAISFEISNTGTAALTTGTISITGTNPEEFTIQNDNCSGQTIAASGTCSFEAVFSPLSAESKSASIEIPSNDPNTPVLSIPINGTAMQSAISVSKDSHNFGSVKINNSSPAQSIEITSTGEADLVIESVAVTGTDAAGFKVQNDNCSGKTLPASETCTIEGVFSPVSKGSKTANIEIKSDDPDNPAMNIALTGTGAQAVVSVSPDSHDFGLTDVETSSQPRSFEISNKGNADLELGTITISGADASEFEISVDSCSNRTLVPLSESCSVEAVFQPTFKGKISVNIEISSDASDTPTPVQLSGTGIKPVVLTVCSGCDYLDIQSAVDNAWDGDIIQVGTGIYNETVNTDGKYVTISATAFKRGDRNGDEIIDLAEAIYALQVIAGTNLK